MRSVLDRIGLSALIALISAIVFLTGNSPALAQGGEPQYFAIRGAKVVPVSGPPVEDAIVVVARGVILAVGKDAAIPADAWVIEGKGLTIYPGLLDALTDVGLAAATAAPTGEAAAGGGALRRTGEAARGPEDRPNSSV